MPRLSWVFAGRTYHFVVLWCCDSFYFLITSDSFNCRSCRKELIDQPLQVISAVTIWLLFKIHLWRHPIVSIIFQEWTVIKYILLNVTVHYLCVVMCPLGSTHTTSRCILNNWPFPNIMNPSWVAPCYVYHSRSPGLKILLAFARQESVWGPRGGGGGAGGGWIFFESFAISHRSRVPDS